MDIIIPIIAFLVGAALGASGYRYYLKRDPARIEKLAAAIKSAGRRFE